MKGFLLAGWLLLGAAAAASDADLVARLEAWQANPLDLLVADPAEIALLPGMDPELAEEIARLRAADGLIRLEDLTTVRGISPVHLEVIRPYVQVGERVGPGGEASWELVGQGRDQGPPRWGQRLRAGARGLYVDFLRVDRGEALRRGAVTAGDGATRLVAGDLVVGVPGGLFATGAGRSRLAPAPLPAPFQLRARTDTGGQAGWTGCALLHEAILLLSLRDPQGTLTWGAALDHSSELSRFGMAVRTVGSGLAASGWLSRDDDVTRFWGQVAIRGRSRHAAGGALLRGPWWAIGGAATRTDGALGFGVDPVSGHRLDRPHRGWQLHGRVVHRPWAAGMIWRELERGDSGVANPVAEAELRWRDPARPLRVELGLRVRPRVRVALVAAVRDVPGELTLRFSHQLEVAGYSELTGASWTGKRGAEELRLAGAWAEGTRSRVWMLSRPGTGAYPVWLRPGEALLSGGLRRSVPRASFGVWVWARAGARGGWDPGAGLAIRLRSRGLVQRLQGDLRDRVRGSPAAGWRPF